MQLCNNNKLNKIKQNFSNLNNQRICFILQILFQIFSYLKLIDLKSIRLVSIRFQQLSYEIFAQRSEITITNENEFEKLKCLETIDIDTVIFMNVNFNDFRCHQYYAMINKMCDCIKTLFFRECTMNDSVLMLLLNSLNNLKCLRIRNMYNNYNIVKVLYANVTKLESISLSGKLKAPIPELIDETFDESKVSTITHLKLEFENNVLVLLRNFNMIKFFTMIQKSLKILKIEFYEFDAEVLRWFNSFEFNLEQLNVQMFQIMDHQAFKVFINHQLSGTPISKHDQCFNPALKNITPTHRMIDLKKLKIVCFYKICYFKLNFLDFSELESLEVCIYMFLISFVLF